MLTPLYTSCLNWPSALLGRHLHSLPCHWLTYMAPNSSLQMIVICLCTVRLSTWYTIKTRISSCCSLHICKILHSQVWSMLPFIVATARHWRVFSCSQPNDVWSIHSRLLLLVACLSGMCTLQTVSAESLFLIQYLIFNHLKFLCCNIFHYFKK